MSLKEGKGKDRGKLEEKGSGIGEQRGLKATCRNRARRKG